MIAVVTPSIYTAMLLATLTLSGVAATVEPAPEVLCGPDIVTIGDAWERVQWQNSEAHRMLAARDCLRLPQKLAAIASHLQFIERGAIMVFGKRRAQLGKAISVIESLKCEITTRVLNGETNDLAARWMEMDATLKYIAAQLPDEALLPSTSFAHLLPPVKPALHVQLEPLTSVTPGQPLRIVFHLVRLDNLAPVSSKDLFEAHGAFLHALICDSSLTDYHHEHPSPTGVPGEWEFKFTPRFNAQYRVWINAVPKHTGREEFAMNVISLPNSNIPPPTSSYQTELSARTDELRGELTWTTGAKLEVNRPTSGSLHLAEVSGAPVRDLEPYMGAFAHIVGIGDDSESILHVHPDGGINSPSDRGGPEVYFTLRAARQGFHRLFVQVKRHGKLQTLTFGVQID